MTTIIYRDGVLVADTAVFDRGCYCGQAVKIHKLPNGTMFGCAGALGDMSRFREWMGKGAPIEERPAFSQDNDSEALIVRPDGTVEWFGATDTIAVVGDFHAIGSGFRIAMGALAHGATAEEAIAICADLDNHTRRPITVLRR